MRRMIILASLSLDLTFDGCEGLQHGLRVGQKRDVCGQTLQIGKGRPTSLGMTLKSVFVAGVKEPNIQLRVKKQRRDVGAVQNILQIVGGRALPLQVSWS